jgi:hypothetical protein
MNTSERVVQHLQRHPQVVICDECFAKALRVSKPLTRMLDVLNPEYVRRRVARCSQCGEIKMSVEAYEMLPTRRRTTPKAKKIGSH